MAYAKLSVPVGPATDGTDDEVTVGSVGDRVTTAVLDDDHKIPARSRDPGPTEGADIQISQAINALDYHKLDREAPTFGVTVLTGTVTTYAAAVWDAVIRHERTGASLTISLPTAIGIEGRVYIIHNVVALACTVDPFSTQTINGATTVSLTQDQWLMIISDNANWLIIGGGGFLFEPTIDDFVNATHDHLDAAGGGVLPGGVPIGAIQAVLGTFSLADNGGVYNETGVVIGAGWKLCDGTVIADSASPFDTRFVPKLDDGRFLRGNAVAGAVGGQATLPNHIHSDTFTLPNHVHTSAAHTHVLSNAGGSTIFVGGDSIRYKTSGLGPNFIAQDATTGSASASGATLASMPLVGATDSRTPVDTGNPTTTPSIDGAVGNPTTSPNIEPVYLNCKYYQRIK